MRIRDNRLLTEKSGKIEREHPSTDFWILLESGIDGTNTVQTNNKPTRPQLTGRGLYGK